jgi:hypothetical protein
LWLHPDDLTPEIGPLSKLVPAGIAACISEHAYHTTYNLSPARIRSLHTVLEDGLKRAATHYGTPTVLLNAADPVQALCAWARETDLAEVVAFAPQVGPIHDILPRLRQALAEAGARLTLIRRPSDATAFAFATAGFFPFWQKMSRHLQTLPQQ